MAARSIASMTLSFGLVSVPIKVYTATESKSGVGFNLMHKDCGTRLKQQYVCPHDGKVVERADMVKGYEFEKDRYVIFEKSELDALEANASHTIDIISFVSTDAINPRPVLSVDCCVKGSNITRAASGGRPPQWSFTSIKIRSAIAYALRVTVLRGRVNLNAFWITFPKAENNASRSARNASVLSTARTVRLTPLTRETR